MAEGVNKDNIQKILVTIDLSKGQEVSQTFVKEEDSNSLMQALKKLEESIGEFKKTNDELSKKNEKLGDELGDLRLQLKEDQIKFDKKLKDKDTRLKNKEEENRILENEKSSLQKERDEVVEKLKDLEVQANMELFKFYKKLDPNFHKNFTLINFDNLKNFNATIGGRDVLKSLYNFIKNEKKDFQIELFEKLFPLHEEIYKFERLKTKEKDYFNDKEHKNIEGTKGQGIIKKVLLAGFKDGNDLRASLVELED
ncbi:hypothetical protein [Campylobacter jejuni]|uniref:hypothetical protein n=1 Tax=Campylobacter jejuni TaxID=197 RepID=UPI000F809963|nr:hypothetical protein [Campylobacter jejuni]